MTRTLRTRTAAGIAGLSILGLVIASVPAFALTNASWNDSEWDSASQAGQPGVGTLDCAAADGLFSTRGAGNFLSGQIAALDLATIAELEGELVTNDGNVVSATPGSDFLGDDAYANPLNVNALNNALSIQLGNLLTFPALGVDVGVVNQYGQAHSDGNSIGASGAVGDSGAIDTGVVPGPTAPTIASFQLGTALQNLLGAGLGGGVANLADVSLNLGAVASFSDLDACPALWDGDIYAHLVRDYLIADLDAELDSPLVGSLVSAVQGVVTSTQNAVNTIASNTTVTLQTALLVPLAPVLTTLGGGTTTTTVGLTVDFSGVNALLDDVISDPGNVLSIDLSSGLITVDLAKLFDPVNGLNNQAPNTQLLIDSDMITTLETAATTALANWVASVGAALTNALTNLVTVNISLDIDGALGDVHVGITGPLGGPLVVGTTLSNCTLPLPAIACPALVVTLNGLQGALGLAATGVLAGVPALILLATGPLVTTLTTVTLPAITGNILTLLDDALSGLFGEDSLASILINAQNAPDPADAGVPIVDYPEPLWAAGLDPYVANPFESGQYDVSALRITLAATPVTPPVLGLDLARSSAGNNILVP